MTIGATAADLVEQQRCGAISARAIVEGHLSHIRAWNGKLHALTEVTEDEALANADAADATLRAGRLLGPLHGVPLVVKDIIDVAGWPTRGGSQARAGVPAAAADAHVVARLRAAGAIVIGKAHTVEFAFGGWGTNVTMGTPWNPHDLARHRVPGGSSSGSGVAVASGMAPLALGTDTGGSVRNPASFCGIVGLKTSFGLVGRGGVMPLSGMLDTVGPMTRSVRDAAIMLDVIAGPDPDDPDSIAASPPSLRDLDRGVRGLRIGLVDWDQDIAIDADTRRCFEQAVDTLQQLGAHIEKLSLPEPLAVHAQKCADLFTIEAYHRYGALAEDDAAHVGRPVRERILAGRDMPAHRLIGLLESRRREIRAFARRIETLDALVTPSTPSPALPLDEVDEQKSPGVFSRFANYLELAALSLPVGFSREGLPIGFQVVVRRLHDGLALRIGAALERALGGTVSIPEAFRTLR